MTTNPVVDLKELDFNDLSVIELPVKVTGKNYILKEASGDAACKYRNSMLACTKLGPDGKPVSVNGIADCEPSLVASCLFEVTEKNTQVPVPLAMIRSWPDRVQKKLAETVKKVSGMETSEENEETLKKQIGELQEKLDKVVEAKEALKNGHSSTTAGSP